MHLVDDVYDWIYLSVSALGTDTGCAGACLYNYNVNTVPANSTDGMAVASGTSGLSIPMTDAHVDGNLVTARDKASEGLLAAGDERMEKLIEFREKLLFFRDPANSKRDTRRMNGNAGNGPLLISARKELLTQLLKLQEEVQLQLISSEELRLIQQMWKAARDPDDGRGVSRIVNKQRGVTMNTNHNEIKRLREMEEDVAREKGVNAETLRRMVAKVEEHSESHRAFGLPNDLLNILKDDLNRSPTTEM